jgi:malate dehydrogenase
MHERNLGHWRRYDSLKRTRNGGAEVINLLQTGSAFYAPLPACTQPAVAILKARHLIVPCAA